MAYPESCFQSLVGIRGICEPKTAMFYLEDVPGISVDSLAKISSGTSGVKFGEQLIETASRLMAADIEGIYNSTYQVGSNLVNGCSSLGWAGGYGAGPKRGIIMKDLTSSAFSRLLLTNLVVKVNADGLFHVVIDDGDQQRVIEQQFQAGVEVEFLNLNFSTKKKQVKIYMQEEDVPMATLTSAAGSSCGCGGSRAVVDDLVYMGLLNNVEQTVGYGFKPCAMITCDPSDVLCYVAGSSPRMLGMALLYKSAELFFQESSFTTRNNKVAGQNAEEKKDESLKLAKLYQDKLSGKGSRGVRDVVMETLQNATDVCVTCNTLVRTAWATG